MCLGGREMVEIIQKLIIVLIVVVAFANTIGILYELVRMIWHREPITLEEDELAEGVTEIVMENAIPDPIESDWEGFEIGFFDIFEG